MLIRKRLRVVFRKYVFVLVFCCKCTHVCDRIEDIDHRRPDVNAAIVVLSIFTKQLGREFVALDVRLYVKLRLIFKRHHVNAR